MKAKALLAEFNSKVGLQIHSMFLSPSGCLRTVAAAAKLIERAQALLWVT